MTAKKNKSKSNTTNYIDLLDEDKAIAGQKFVCLSFISPENILKDKNLYFFENYLKNFEIKKSFEKFTQFLNFVSYKYNLDFEKLNKDMEEFVAEEKDNLFTTTIEDDYKTYLDANEEKLQKQFNEIHDFQTNTRGLKVRGVFEHQEEAEMKCKLLREHDPNHDVYVGQVGMWMPFHPEAYKTGKVEYLEKELNELMHKKNENDKVSKEEFTKRVKESKRKAIEENIKKASKEGNKLMQTIDEEGNLINADRMDVPGKNLLFGDGDNDDVMTADLRKELFDGENVIIGSQKDNDHGLGEVLKRQREQQAIAKEAEVQAEETREDTTEEVRETETSHEEERQE